MVMNKFLLPSTVFDCECEDFNQERIFYVKISGYKSITIKADSEQQAIFLAVKKKYGHKYYFSINRGLSTPTTYRGSIVVPFAHNQCSIYENVKIDIEDITRRTGG